MTDPRTGRDSTLHNLRRLRWRCRLLYPSQHGRTEGSKGLSKHLHAHASEAILAYGPKGRTAHMGGIVLLRETVAPHRVARPISIVGMPGTKWPWEHIGNPAADDRARQRFETERAGRGERHNDADEQGHRERSKGRRRGRARGVARKRANVHFHPAQPKAKLLMFRFVLRGPEAGGCMQDTRRAPTNSGKDRWPAEIASHVSAPADMRSRSALRTTLYGGEEDSNRCGCRQCRTGARSRTSMPESEGRRLTGWQRGRGTSTV